MATVKLEDLLAATRTGLNTNPVDAIRTALRAYRQEHKAADSQDAIEIVDSASTSLAWVMQAGTAATLGAMDVMSGSALLRKHMQLLFGAWPALPFDDPNNAVLTQKKIRNAIRNLLAAALSLPAAQAWVADAVEGYKRVMFKDYQGTDPCEAQATAAMATVAAATDEAAVKIALNVLRQLESRLEPKNV